MQAAALAPSPYRVSRAVRRQAARELRSTGAARRAAVDALVARLHGKQLELHNDPARQQAALCTRQAGKTFWCVTELLITALTKKRSFSIYINESRAECLRVVWENQDDGGLFRMIEDVLVPLGITIGQSGSGAAIEYNKTYLTLYFRDTKARIALVGCDDEEAVRKLRGPTYDLVIVDESQKAPHLKEMAEQSLFPALMKKKGKIVLLGTPGKVPDGVFFEVTRADGRALPGWSVHRFSFVDNEAIPDRLEVVENLKRENGWDDDNDTLLREWYGLWVADASLLVYKLAGRGDECFYDGVLEKRDDWRYLVGIDLGFNPAPWAFVVWAFNEEEPALYEVESLAIPDLSTDQQAALIEGLIDRYEPDRIVCDAGAGGLKQIVEGDYAGRYGLPVDVAQKHEKDSAIETFNSDLLLGRIKLIRGSALAEEMLALPWLDKRKGLRRIENPKFANHCCDAALYSYRESYFYQGEPKTEPVKPGTPEWVEARINKHREKLRREADVDDDAFYGDEEYIDDAGAESPGSYYGFGYR